ncbi:MAG: aminotransferase class I/II-fold pyridoxal phosphate-dependent enzyme [Planctomycetaceae bacterium]
MSDPSSSPDHPSRMGHIPAFVTEPSAPPIYQTTAFDIPDLQVLAQLYDGTASGFVYTRDSNPNHTALGKSIADLEGAESAAVFASGMGAIAAVALSLCGAGQHIVVARSLYGITIKLMTRLQQQFGIRVTYVDACNPDDVAAAVTSDTRFALIETVSNPLLEVADLAAVASALGDVPLVVDSTFTTPALIRPLQHGAAVVVHSASKYLNGHGDVMLGVAAGDAKTMKAVRETASVFGQNANPFESWLTQRGLRTLPLRMRQVCQTTQQLAAWLNQHPLVASVYHPGLPQHPTHQTAQRLYPEGCGGIVSFALPAGGKAAVNELMRALPSIPFSPTLADSRTTLSHPATTSHGFMTKAARSDMGITDELIRLSVGLEPFELLSGELDAALSAVRC